MPGFSEITDRELEELQNYVRKRAVETSISEIAPTTSKERAESGSH